MHSVDKARKSRREDDTCDPAESYNRGERKDERGNRRDEAVACCEESNATRTLNMLDKEKPIKLVSEALEFARSSRLWPLAAVPKEGRCDAKNGAVKCVGTSTSTG